MVANELKKLSEVLRILEQLSYVLECVALDYMGEAKTELNRLVGMCKEGPDIEGIDEIAQQLQTAYDLAMKDDKRQAASILSRVSRALWKLCK